MSYSITLPDGTKCRKGMNCKRHASFYNKLPVATYWDSEEEQTYARIDAEYGDERAHHEAHVRLFSEWQPEVLHGAMEFFAGTKLETLAQAKLLAEAVDLESLVFAEEAYEYIMKRTKEKINDKV